MTSFYHLCDLIDVLHSRVRAHLLIPGHCRDTSGGSGAEPQRRYRVSFWATTSTNGWTFKGMLLNRHGRRQPYTTCRGERVGFVKNSFTILEG